MGYMLYNYTTYNVETANTGYDKRQQKDIINLMRYIFRDFWINEDEDLIEIGKDHYDEDLVKFMNSDKNNITESIVNKLGGINEVSSFLTRIYKESPMNISVVKLEWI